MGGIPFMAFNPDTGMIRLRIKKLYYLLGVDVEHHEPGVLCLKARVAGSTGPFYVYLSMYPFEIMGRDAYMDNAKKVLALLSYLAPLEVVYDEDSKWLADIVSSLTEQSLSTEGDFLGSTKNT